MATHVHHRLDRRWDEIVRQVNETGRPDVPFVESMTLDADHRLSIWLRAPGIVEGSHTVFVDIARMTPIDSLALDVLIDALRQRFVFLDTTHPNVVFTGSFWAVYHAGGADYEFYGSHPEVRLLSSLAEWEQAVVWGILRSIAVLCVRYPDEQASRIKTAR